ncbi:acetyltransferase (GNAT) family protein [Peptococcaceae bacterium CEB3]|nr:acetyltransferase (GNAT) family protein [Peptococcaceae bacterium CEB3]
MSKILKIKQIGYDELEILLSMYREKAEWLNRIGQPMWSMEYLEKQNFITKYDYPDCFVAYINDIPIGGFILLESDKLFWGTDDHLAVYYIHKLVVTHDYTGQGNAEKMLGWIEEYAKTNGKEAVRLDCYEDRKYLLQLYKSCGFNLVEVKVMPDGTRIAQFEKRLQSKDGRTG